MGPKITIKGRKKLRILKKMLARSAKAHIIEDELIVLFF
jgi:hypothetical protein